MKKLFALSLILFLISLAASAQLRNTDLFRRNLLLQRYRSSLLISPEQFRLRTDNLRLQIARERILSDGVITPLEKRKLKKINRYQRRMLFIKRHHRLS